MTDDNGAGLAELSALAALRPVQVKRDLLTHIPAPKWPTPAGRVSRPGLSLVLPINSAEGPVSRILSCAVIPLGAALPRTLISDLPGGFGILRTPAETCRRGPAARAAWAHRADAQRRLTRGKRFPPYLVLLRVGFTLPPALPPERCALTAPFHPYPGRRPAASALRGRPPERGVAEAVYFLWHWPSTGLEARVPDVIRHTALRSSDFPPPAASACARASGSDRPVLLPRSSVPQ